MSVQSYRDLIVWQEAMQLARSVYRLSHQFPEQEMYGLVSQLRRCAVSIPSNIAEGHGRDSTRDYLRHLSIATGSLAELETQLLLSSDFAYASSEETAELLNLADVLGRRLRSLKRSLNKKLDNN